MATTAKNNRTLGKERVRSASPSNSHSIDRTKRSTLKQSPTASATSTTTTTHSDKPVPHYLKPTKSFTHEVSRHVRMPATTHSSTAKPALNRRRSFDNKPGFFPPGSSQRSSFLSSPSPQTCRSLSIASRTPSSPKPIARPSSVGVTPKSRVDKKSTSVSLSTARKKSPSIKVRAPASASASTGPDLLESMSNVESEHEEAEGLMSCAIDEELAQIERSGMSTPEIPIEENSECSSIVSEEQAASLAKVEIKANIADQEEANNNDTHLDEDSLGETKAKEAKDVKAETEEDFDTKVVLVEESGDETKLEVVEEGKVVKEGDGEGEEEAKAGSGAEDSAAGAVKSQVVGQGSSKKESPAYNDVIEETARKLIAEKRKNKVRALAGAFETVISLQESEPSSQPE